MMALEKESLVGALTSNQVKYLAIFSKHKDTIRKLVTYFLIVYLAYICVQLMLSVLLSNMQTQTSLKTNTTNVRLKMDAQDVRPYQNLFGQFQKIQPKKNYKTVKQTRLNLTLLGILFREKGALAIIKNGNKQPKTYQVDDKITSGVSVEDIAKNYVVIEANGRLEKILIKFDYMDKDKQANKTVDLNINQKIKKKITHSQRQKLNKYFQNIATKPLDFLSLVSVKPYFSNGKFGGFKINPSKEKQLFYDLGFQKNDIVLRVNDVTLDNLSASSKVMKLLKKTKQFDVYLKRNGEQRIVAIDLTR